MVHYSETFPDIIQGVLSNIESDTEGTFQIGEMIDFTGYRSQTGTNEYSIQWQDPRGFGLRRRCVEGHLGENWDAPKDNLDGR